MKYRHIVANSENKHVLDWWTTSRGIKRPQVTLNRIVPDHSVTWSPVNAVAGKTHKYVRVKSVRR